MIVRTLVLLAYLVVLGVALVLQYRFPSIAVYVFYGFLFWLIASFFVFRLPGMSRRVPGVGGPRPSGSSLPTSDGRASSALPSAPTIDLGFCAFCGSHLSAGARSCPTCGHEVRRF